MKAKSTRRNALVSVNIVLRTYFGDHWFRNTLALTVITVTPAIYYWNDIALAPEKLVEEWIKLIATTVFVAFVVEVIVERRDRHEARTAELRTIKRDYVDRIDRITRLLRSLSEVAADDLSTRDRLAAAIHREWRELVDRYHSDFVLATPKHLTDSAIASIGQLNFVYCENLIDVALTTSPGLRRQRCDDAIENLETIRATFANAQTSET